MARVGICAIVRDEVEYLAHWLAFHVLQGVSRVRIYDNGSRDGTREMLDDCARQGLLEVQDWPTVGHFDQTQRAAYVDGAAHLAGSVDFVAFIDVDEFLFDRGGRPLPEALDAMPGDAAVVGVQQRVFGHSNLADYAPEPVFGRLVRRARDNYYEHFWMKAVARPELIEAFDSVHSVQPRSGRRVLPDGEDYQPWAEHPGRADRIATDGLVLHHYTTKTPGEFRRKQAKWQAAQPNMAARYGDQYFRSRAIATNVVEDSVLVPWTAPVLDLVATWQGLRERSAAGGGGPTA